MPLHYDKDFFELIQIIRGRVNIKIMLIIVKLNMSDSYFFH